jgi:hypothetical protein
MGPCHHGMAHPQLTDGGTAPRCGRYVRIYLSSLGQPTKGGPPAWALSEVLTSHHKNLTILRTSHTSPGVSLLVGPCEFGNESLGSTKCREFHD